MKRELERVRKELTRVIESLVKEEEELVSVRGEYEELERRKRRVGCKSGVEREEERE